MSSRTAKATQRDPVSKNKRKKVKKKINAIESRLYYKDFMKNCLLPNSKRERIP